MKNDILKRIMEDQREAASFLEKVLCLSDIPVVVWDLDQNLLLGASSPQPNQVRRKHKILCAGEVIGWTSGGEPSKALAGLLTYLAAREVEKADLLDEILDLYRQINLLFNLSGKLSASLHLETVAKVTLEEACRLIEVTGGSVVLMDETQALLPIATLGETVQTQEDLESFFEIIATSFSEASAEIINNLPSDPRYTQGMDRILSLLFAPLLSKQKPMGVIILVHEAPVTYTAADLNLLRTLASQASPAIENALHYARTLREAQAREERLKQQVRDLRIELDEARQQQKVAEITGSAYYQRLRRRADTLRSIIDR